MKLRLLEGAGDQRYIDVARAELGQREIKGKEDNPRIREYHSITSAGEAADEVPWCASFVGWCLEKSGIRSTRSKAASSYITWGQPCDLEPGAIVVFGKSDPDAKGTGHVAFLIGVDGENVLVLGGNQGNAVTKAWRKKANIAACRAPDIRQAKAERDG